MYLIFAGEFYYAKGGMNDFKGVAPTVSWAHNVITQNIYPAKTRDEWEWWQVVDAETWRVVDQSRDQAHNN
jgi:hypothetical protein